MYWWECYYANELVSERNGANRMGRGFTMKTFGKVAVLAMAMALAVVLAGCGGSASSSAASSASASSASASATSASASSAATSTTASSASASTSASAASSAAAAVFKAGKVSGDTYTNEFFGVKFVAPSGFTFNDDAKMAEMNAAVGASLNDESITKALENGVAYFDMACANENGTNVNVTIEHGGSTGASALTPEQYLNVAKESLADQLKSSGAEVKDVEVTTFKNAAGKDLASMKVTLEVQGVTLYEQLICLKAGDYFMTITATSQNQDDLEGLLKQVSEL